MWFFPDVSKRNKCRSTIEIFNGLLRSNGKYVALCFYMCRCASNWGFQICFQIYSAFWLILARACRMTSIMSHFLLLPGHQSCLSDYIKLLLPNYEIFKKNINEVIYLTFSVILYICCLNEMAALKSHGLVETKLYKNAFFNGSHMTLMYVFACHFWMVWAIDLRLVLNCR